MTLTLKKIDDFQESSSRSFLMSTDNIQKMGLLASVCYFTAGTEGRFAEIDEDMDSLSIVEKY